MKKLFGKIRLDKNLLDLTLLGNLRTFKQISGFYATVFVENEPARENVPITVEVSLNPSNLMWIAESNPDSKLISDLKESFGEKLATQNCITLGEATLDGKTTKIMIIQNVFLNIRWFQTLTPREFDSYFDEVKSYKERKTVIATLN